jgi:hypothetical protein
VVAEMRMWIVGCGESEMHVEMRKCLDMDAEMRVCRDADAEMRMRMRRCGCGDADAEMRRCGCGNADMRISA